MARPTAYGKQFGHVLWVLVGCTKPAPSLPDARAAEPHSPDASDASAVSDAGEKCGTIICPAGEVCCNPLKGICTPPGGMCIQ